MKIIHFHKAWEGTKNLYMLPASDFTCEKYCQGMEHVWKSRHIVEDHKKIKCQEMVTAAKQNPQISANNC